MSKREFSRGTMFEELKLLGTPEKSIVVQTRKGTPIENLIEVEPGQKERQIYHLFLSRYRRPSWIERTLARGVYNCAGHVWASRRTSILETKEWLKILNEDGYRLLSPKETPSPGDLILYKESHDYIHVGMIMEMCEGVTKDSTKIPRVLSKWNSIFGEVSHFEQDVPYDNQGLKTTIEYWTDRPLFSS
jgi:hypothetical protein